MSVLKRKYNEEIPDSAKYKVPQASIPSRRTQIKISPDGKTSFGPNEIIRIMIPPQGYFDPEYSYLSFDVALTCPSTYVLKALEVWNSHSTAFMYDCGLGGIIAVGKGGMWITTDTDRTTTGIQNVHESVNDGFSNRSKAQLVPFMRFKQALTATESAINKQRVSSQAVLFEWVPVGHIYPVLPFSSHGFFNRVVVRTANNTPIEDIQDYDYLCALLGQLMQSEGYVSTMGSMLEGWGDIRERAKLGLSCVKDLRYCEPRLRGDRFSRAGYEESVLFSDAYGYSSAGSFTTVTTPSGLPRINGLSPEGVKDATLKETTGRVKLTCNLNLGLLQQRQNLPLLFSGGLILELYTAPFERCMSFSTIFSRIDATDIPNLSHAGMLNGFGELVDATALDCCLPRNLTNALGISPEVDTTNTNTGVRKVGRPLDETACFYYKSGITTSSLSANATNENVAKSSCAHQAFLIESVGSPGSRLLAQAGTVTLHQLVSDAYDQVVGYTYNRNYNSASTVAASTQITSDTGTHVAANSRALENRYRNAGWMTVGGSNGWTYTLENVELRADMVQFSQTYDESVAAIVDSDEGLPITFQTFSVQKLLYNGQRSTLTMNERARSIQFALAVFKDPEMERATHTYYGDNDSRYFCFGDFNVPIGFAKTSGLMSLTSEPPNVTPDSNDFLKSSGWLPSLGPWDAYGWAKTVDPQITRTNGTAFTPTALNDPVFVDWVIVPPQLWGLTTTTEASSSLTAGVLANTLCAFRSAPLSTAQWAGSDVLGPQISHSFNGQKFVAVSNPWRQFMRIIPQDAQSVSIFPDLKDYQFRIGTRFIPASPVDCSSGAVQAYIELMKAVGMYGSFSGDGKRALMPGIRLTPDLYAKRICTRDSPLLAAAYGSFTLAGSTTQKQFNAGITGTLDCKDYVGQRFRVPTRFVVGQNFSDIPDHAAGVDTATQALSVELALNGEMSPPPANGLNCYVFLNVRRDMFIRCGGQIEILY